MDKVNLVSVIITTYNRAHLIKRAIMSVLNQTYHYYEIIIVDDASSDATPEVISSIGDERVRYIRHSCNKGWPEGRNTGLKYAEGEYIAFIDSDDYWYPEKLSKQISVFKKYKEVDFVFTNGYYKKEGELLFRSNRDSGFIPQGREHFPLKDIVPLPSSWLFKKKIVNKIGFFNKDIITWEDGDFFVRVADSFKVYFLDEPLVFWYSPQESFDPLKEIEGRELFLNKHEGRMAQDREYLVRFLKTLGKDYIRLGNSKKARYFLLKALALSPFNSSIWVKLLKTLR